ILSSKGTFDGELDRIAVNGETRTPDFRLDVAGNPVPLDTTFAAVVDGTDGDTYLNEVSATLLHTAIAAKGAVVGADGVKGKSVQVKVTIASGRIEDVLKLAVKGDRPLMSGKLALHANLDLPAGKADVL